MAVAVAVAVVVVVFCGRLTVEESTVLRYIDARLLLSLSKLPPLFR